jgi:aconitate hydratase 2/2-methylisocitrate dehydratase
MADIEDAAGGAKAAKPKIAVKLPKVTDEDVAKFKEAYNAHVAERAGQGLPPLALDSKQTQCVVKHCLAPPAGDEQFYFDLLANRVPPGVDDSTYVKANFLNDVSKGIVSLPIVLRLKAIELFGIM